MTQDNSEQIPQPPMSHRPTSRLMRSKPSLSLLVAIAVSVVLAILYTHFYVQQTLKQTTLVTQQLRQQQMEMQNLIHHNHDEIKKSTEARLNILNTTLTQALQEQRYQAPEWIMLKARYYLELASINTIWTNDNSTTLALLKEADTLLSRIEKENITDVRKAIAEEQTTIKAMPKQDVTGILSNLYALQQAIDTLTDVHATPSAGNAILSATQPNSSPTTWRERWQQTIQTLKSLLIIRHHNHGVTSYMTPADIIMQRETLRLMLQEAQWAVLQQKTQIYQMMLSQASETAARLFDPNDSKTIALISQINQLKNTDFTQPKPSLDVALKLLNQVIQAQSNENPGSET